MKRSSNIVKVLCIALLTCAFAWSTSCGGAGTVVSIVVTPEAPSIAVNATQQFTATGARADGSTVDLTATATWSSSDAAVADFQTTDTGGLATALAGGTVTITATDSASGVSGSTDMTVAALSGTIMALYPTNGSNWNDYVKNDGTDMFKATDTACNAAADGPWYNACLNGGVMRAVTATGRSVCDGLTATDSLGAFNWVCDDTTNDVRMVSVGFAAGMGLSDLIDFDTGAWRQLNVTVYRSGNAYLATDMTTWWTNPVVLNNTGAAMATEGDVYIVTAANPGATYTIGGDKISLLVKPGVIMHGPGTNGNVIESTNHSFLWIEGALDATGDNDGVYINGVKFSQMHRLKIQHSNNAGITFDASASNLLSHFIITDVGADGIELNNSSNNMFNAMTLFGNGDDNIFMNNASFDNAIFNYTSGSNQAIVIYMLGAANNLVFNVTAANGVDGLSIYNAADGNTVMNFASVNSSGTGLTNSNVAGGTFANMAFANSFRGVSLSTSSNDYFTGLFNVGNNTVNCAVAGGTSPGLVDTTCAPNGASDFGAPITGITLAGSFVAKVDSDTVNPDGATGVEAYDNITDWIDFENMFRGWGLDGSAFPNADNQGHCTSGDTCRIWDWSLASADTVIRNVLPIPTGDDTLTHTWSDASTATFLRNAVEIFDDGIGNENGLCESNEACLYTPNIGSYQGHGNLISAGAFTDGAITGVTLMQYETNGR